ncbi:MAG TPA: lysyl oxidase family protein [Streptosporangiaceae bacterium]|nr:lysyl oxidase family protein [Streptosporangiaceae bacterium]
MNLSRWGLRLAAVAAAGLTAAATLAAGPATAQGPAAKQGAAAGPTVKLVAAQNDISVPQFGKQQVFLDPGIYVEAFGSALEFDVQRASYSQPLTLTQVIHLAGHVRELRPLPAWLLDGWNGLRRFLRLSVTNSHGKTVGSHVLPLCPNTFNPQRAGPKSPFTSPYPQECSSDPFERGMVEGIQRGWGVDPFGGFGFGSGARFRLKLGTYTATMRITRVWAGLLHVTPRAAMARVRFRVVKGSRCSFICPGSHRHTRTGTLPRLPSVPLMQSPPSSVLPDLSPLPSWGISLGRSGGKKKPVDYQLQFGATVWIGGNSPLDVEGFRVHGSPVMQAYQYFWRNGHVVGRARAGTMGFDHKKGHNHWHFQQFAQYRLLNSSKTLVLRSRKVGFCIAPTDPVNLILRHATWVPSFTGFGGACGSPTALWVQEMLPVGWGDTYFQSVAGQSFDITHLPNGTYYIEIIANPEKVLHESNLGNDISLRKVILGGTPDHRTITVPAFHGIDAEH